MSSQTTTTRQKVVYKKGILWRAGTLKEGVTIEDLRAKPGVEVVLPWPEEAEQPGVETLEDWICDVEYPEAVDGCIIEPDGVCQHGYPSWLLLLGYV